MASIRQALQGAKVELAQKPTLLDKARLCTSYARIIGQELVGTLLLAPYGYRTWSLHRNLPSPGLQRPVQDAGANHQVYLLKDQRYGQASRNLIDVYIPEDALKCREGASIESGHHMAIFCHGGIWATGEKWQFAPLAASLAQRGIVACVLQYSLYPQSLVPEMVEEVVSAIDWLSDQSPHYGASPSKISVVGHSAGAQLAFMAVLNLLARAVPDKGQRSSMPAKCIGMAGVYDISTHFAYEQGRGVAYLSTMARAMGGRSGFASQSPAVILEAAANAAGAAGSPGPGLDTRLAQKAGQEAGDSGLFEGSLSQKGTLPSVESAVAGIGETARECPLPLSMEDLSRLPQAYFISSKCDITVPWTQSLQMHEAVQRCGGTSEHLVYDDVTHGDFVIDWQYDGREASTLSKSAEDLVRIISGEGQESSGRLPKQD